MTTSVQGTDGVVDLPSTEEWKELTAHADQLRGVHLRQLFADDPGRGSTMVAHAGDLYLDYSKHRATEETIGALMAVARRAGVEERRNAMFAGRHINNTEDRAVLHVALRMPRDAHLEVDGQDVVAEVHGVLDRMGAVASSIRSGNWVGATGHASTRWSTSASGAPTWGRPWPTRLFSTMPTPTSSAGSCPTSTRWTSTTRRRPRSGRDAVRGQFQDVHHPRDPDERVSSPRLAAGRPGRREDDGGPSLRGRFHQRRRR